MIENFLAQTMASDWLEQAVAEYNDESFNRREEYVAQIHFPVSILEQILGWAFKSLPDEILVGIDVKDERIDPEILAMFQGEKHQENLFAGQGYRINEAKMVNRGDSYSVHHLPEEWTDEVFGSDRGPRAGENSIPRIKSTPSVDCAASASASLGIAGAFG